MPSFVGGPPPVSRRGSRSVDALRSAALVVALAAIASAGVEETIRVRYAWSAPTDCRGHAAIVGVTATVDARTRQATERGRVRHQGDVPIRDVTVCIGR